LQSEEVKAVFLEAKEEHEEVKAVFLEAKEEHEEVKAIVHEEEKGDEKEKEDVVQSLKLSVDDAANNIPNLLLLLVYIDYQSPKFLYNEPFS
jgi:hypothetical protein